jgi:hypothetical protein
LGWTVSKKELSYIGMRSFYIMEIEDGSAWQAKGFRAWGLNIASCMDLPEFLPGNGEAPDVVVCYGAVPEALEEVRAKGVRYQAGPGRFLLTVDGIARFLVADGRKIYIQRAADAEDDAVRLFLQGSAFGALLHQRGILPLHASAIQANGKAVLFCGVSGIGKSTLAVAFLKRGYPVLADDICALSAGDDGIPMVLPGFPQIKLWADAIRKLEEDLAFLPKVRQNLEKYGWPLKTGFSAEPAPLDRLYVLSTTNTDRFEMVPVNGLEKFNTLLKNTYRFRFTEGLGSKPEHFHQCAVVGRHAAVRRVTRPQRGFRVEALMDLLEKDFLA